LRRTRGLTAQLNPVPVLCLSCARLRMVTARPGA
jgi:hypothetical protein